VGSLSHAGARLRAEDLPAASVSVGVINRTRGGRRAIPADRLVDSDRPAPLALAPGGLPPRPCLTDKAAERPESPPGVLSSQFAASLSTARGYSGSAARGGSFTFRKCVTCVSRSPSPLLRFALAADWCHSRRCMCPWSMLVGFVISAGRARFEFQLEVALIPLKTRGSQVRLLPPSESRRFETGRRAG